jgi:type II secretory pathway predicted ATPase ExeA
MNPSGPNQRDVASFSDGRSRDAGLTYEPYYRLTQKPFSLFADPRFLYRSAIHAPAFDDLLGAIRRREGLIVVTGDIGMGKTTLCRAALEHLDRKTFSAFVPDPFMSREDLLKALLIDFGVMSVDELRSGHLHAASRLELSYVLYEFLDSLVPLQAVAVMVIDEAQNLSVPLLEEVRILSELVGREKLLQVVLVGQIELEEKLKLPQMRQLDQRVTMRCTLTPLAEDEVSKYIAHRLSVAGGGHVAVTFAPDALHTVYQISRGVPRLINLLCDRSLHDTWRAKLSSVHNQTVLDAAARLGLGAAPTSTDLNLEHIAKVFEDQPPSVESPPLEDSRQPTSSEPGIAQTDDVFDTEPDSIDRQVLEIPRQPDQPLGAFLSEQDIELRTKQQTWMDPMSAVAATVIAALLAGGLTLYFLARGFDTAAAQLPPLPPGPSQLQPFAAPLHPETTTAIDGPAVPVMGKANEGVMPMAESYGIQIASFQEADRAQRSVEELASIGVNARAVERDLGTGGRWHQVLADGYVALEAVQMDLGRVRQLPGYSDARLFRYRPQS